ncbi:MAG: DUF1049 domain-containing protein [Nitrospinaceae bacterium]|nr:LapA family protein [Nitrospinaceae bacterium]NIR53393.1 LapA family protein [Nitrospinaceae bacterium]NIS83797.1 LapA family protein [Nitrospinaceae bacterium]NIT81981.1 LapA family protein [Nitrospinaceae bacterium]NIU42917.1 LapA family protein [Nitrospinaceae bacterium]
MKNLKLYLGLALLILIVIFTLQNAEVVTIKFLFWDYSVSRSIMIFMVLVIGILVGWILSGWGRHTRSVKK